MCNLGPKKSRFSRPTPSNAPSNDVALLKTLKYKRHKNNWYIGSFKYPGADVYSCCVLEGWGGLLVAVLGEPVFRGWGLVGRAPPPPPTIV